MTWAFISFEEVYSSLEVLFDNLLEDPWLMDGFYDITFKEITYIYEKEVLPLDILEVLAEDHYFEYEHKRLGLTKKESEIVTQILSSNFSLEKRYELLKPKFPFIEMRRGE